MTAINEAISRIEIVPVIKLTNPERDAALKFGGVSRSFGQTPNNLPFYSNSTSHPQLMRHLKSLIV